jgi:endonuclease YncB( thermonuclease family)
VIKIFVAAAAIVITTISISIAHAETISGPSRVIDSDTVVVAGIHIRLKGVDGAERGLPVVRPPGW